MIIYSSITFAFAAAVLTASAISAQRPDSAHCRSLLTAPVKDSVVVTVGLTTRAFDSIQVEEATTLDLVSAVLAAFPALRFVPLELRGCPLASMVEMPFNFQLSR